MTLHLDISPTVEAPEITGCYLTIGVREFDEDKAIALAMTHPEVSGAQNPQVEDIAPLFDDVFEPGETVTRIGGRIFHGAD